MADERREIGDGRGMCNKEGRDEYNKRNGGGLGGKRRRKIINDDLL